MKGDIPFDPQPVQAADPDEELGKRGNNESAGDQRPGEPVLAAMVFQRKYQKQHGNGTRKKEAQVEPEMRLGLGGAEHGKDLHQRQHALTQRQPGIGTHARQRRLRPPGEPGQEGGQEEGERHRDEIKVGR